MAKKFTRGTLNSDNGTIYRQTTFIHANSNLLASIDVKTTGLDANEFEIYEIAIIPVDSFLHRRKDRLPLDLLIQPSYPEKIDWGFMEKQNGVKPAIEKAIERGHPPHIARRLFERWVEDLYLPPKKKICPIGFNYGHEGRFLRKWMGHNHYDLVFDDTNIRDVRVIARFLNDLADLRGAPYPFMKVGLSQLATNLKVFQDYGRIRSALGEAAVTAEVYREMLKMLKIEVGLG